MTAIAEHGATAVATAVRMRTVPGASTLLFADEFDTLDLTTATHQGTWRPNDTWQNINLGYRDFAGTNWNLNPNHTPTNNPFTTTNATLTITAPPPPTHHPTTIANAMASQGQTGTVPTWSGGFLVTNTNLLQIHYGYIEIRARYRNTGPGMFPALWLYATQGSNNPTNKGGAEIDIMEIFGDPTHYDTTLHYYTNNQTQATPSRHTSTPQCRWSNPQERPVPRCPLDRPSPTRWS